MGSRKYVGVPGSAFAEQSRMKSLSFPMFPGMEMIVLPSLVQVERIGGALSILTCPYDTIGVRSDWYSPGFYCHFIMD